MCELKMTTKFMQEIALQIKTISKQSKAEVNYIKPYVVLANRS